MAGFKNSLVSGFILAAVFLAPASLHATSYDDHPADAPAAMGLGTTTGFELGVQASYYRYQEHVTANSEFMHETGPFGGLTFDATKAFSHGWFITGDGRIAYGRTNYQGSGTKNDNDNFLGDFRLLGGKDFVFDNIPFAGRTMGFDISPYVGFGYRILYNDLRGQTSTGALGYGRDSQYFYLPVGVTPRFALDSNSRLSTNIEYDQLILGRQSSLLSDTGTGATDLVNHQHSGYGLRGSVMYERTSWSVGPFFDYWNIDASTVNCDNVICGYEPHNQTIEYGLQARYRF